MKRVFSEQEIMDVVRQVEPALMELCGATYAGVIDTDAGRSHISGKSLAVNFDEVSKAITFSQKHPEQISQALKDIPVVILVGNLVVKPKDLVPGGV